jgi:hypothetical protein
MRNINNRLYHQKHDLKGCSSGKNRALKKILFMLWLDLTAKAALAVGPGKIRANSYPLQNPIKNIICHPE